MGSNYSYVIPGQPRVKKNGQKVAVRKGKPVKYNTQAYKDWHATAAKYLMGQPRPAEPISTPLLLVCKFFMQTKGRVDLSALYEGIQDLLVEMHILADDWMHVVVGHDGSRVYYDKNNPRIEVELVPTTPTFPPDEPKKRSHFVRSPAPPFIF